MEKEKKTPDKIYSEIELDEEATKPISFRVDAEAYKKIVTLEKIKSKNRSTIIKEAIDAIFNEMMFANVSSELFKINRNVFPKLKYVGSMFMGTVFNENEENPFKRLKSGPFRCISTYKLGYPEYYSKDKNFTCSLSTLSIELTTEGTNILKIKVSIRGVTEGRIEDVDPLIFHKISQIASKRNFQIDTKNEKDKTSQNLFFEKRADYDVTGWIKNYKEELERLKNVIEEIVVFLDHNKKTIKKPEKI